MQEITILLGSLAGIATAIAVRRRPKIQLQSLGASSQIRSQITSLKIERDILTKTISRLYESDDISSNIQKDKLLTKYQHQLGIILARIEKLEQASEHPDLGPVGDGLITLMDQKLARLDERLYEISSRIASQTHKESTDVQSKAEKPETRVETKSVVQSKTHREVQTKSENVHKVQIDVHKEVQTETPPTIDNTRSRPKQSFEITTLTNIPHAKLETPNIPERLTDAKNDIKLVPDTPKIKKDDIKHEILSTTIVPNVTIPQTSENVKVLKPSKPKVTEETESKRQDQSSKKTEDITHDARDYTTDDDPLDKLDDDSLDDITLEDMQKNIAKILSDLDQAEVE